MAIVLFVLLVCGIPSAVMIVSERSSKRGCGRGCATCGNREICHGRRGTQDKEG